MFDLIFWNKLGLLFFIIAVAGLWGNYSIESVRWIYGGLLAIGILLNLMPSQYYQKRNKEKK